MLGELSRTKLILAGGTLAAALTIAVVMNWLDQGPSLGAQASATPPQPLSVEQIELTSSSALPLTPTISGGAEAVVPASVASGTNLDGEPECQIGMTADAAVAAMVNLEVTAACLPNERFVLHHNGMMFSAVTNASGMASLSVPALTPRGVYIASFANGDGAVVQSEVTDLYDYDRVVLQWRGDAGLGLHAREYNADYFSAGHIHADQIGSLQALSRGSSGFLHTLGAASGEDPLFAHVYTFPSRRALTDGTIAMTVEAEITSRNCALDVEAQTLEVQGEGSMQVKDVVLAMPDCDAIGDFLVLKNLVEDVTLAANN